MKMGNALLIPIMLIAACGSSRPRASFAGEDVQRFVVSLMGENVGYMTMAVERLGEDSLLVHQDMEWVIVLLGTERHVSMNTIARTGLDFDLGSLVMTMSDGTSDISVHTIRRESSVETTINTSGREISRSVDFQGDYLPAFMDLAMASLDWVPGEERVYDTFDPSTGSILEARVVCQAEETVDLLGDQVLAYRLLISQAGMNNLVWVHEGQIVREEEPGLGMVLTRVPPGSDGRIDPQSDLYLLYSVSSTVVNEPRAGGERVWLLEGDIDWNTFTLDYDGLQSSEPGPVVTVSAFLPSPGKVPSFPISISEVPADLHPHLQPEPLLQSDDPAIVALANELTADSRDAWEAAAAICRYVDRAVEDVPTVSLPSAVEVLDTMRGDCNEHTALFVALARAAGIPAVVCNGIVYIDEGRFGYHAWPAVWVGEWVAMDPTFGMLLADATHIILAMGSLEDQYTINAVIGRLSVREITE